MRELDMDVIRNITFFENSTKAHVRDCIINGDVIYFLVEAGEISKALGKNGSNIKVLQAKMNKRIKVWEYDERPEKFIKNMIPSAESVSINGKVASASVPAEEKGKTIGKEGSNIKNMKEMLKRNSSLDDLEIK